MTVHDLLAAKWKPTPNGWAKLCVEMRRHSSLYNKEEVMYIVYATLSDDPEVGETAFAAVSESTSLSEIEDIIRSTLSAVLASKYYKFTPKHRRTLYNWLYDNGQRITPT